MNGTHGTPLHLWRLMDAQLNGTISEREIQDLDSLLLGDEEASRTFLEYARIHAELHLLAAAQSADAETLVRERMQPSPTAPVIVRRQGPGGPKPRGRGLLAEREKIDAGDGSARLGGGARFVTAATLMAMLLGAGIVSGLLVLSGVLLRGIRLQVNQPAVARSHDNALMSPSMPSPTDVPAPNAVAQLTRVAHCRWSDAGEYYQPGDRLAAGQLLDLAAGVVELRFDAGVKVILQGPARADLTSAMAMRLQSGKMTAEILRPEARGFQVQTPKGKVVDLGTEFGVEVTPTRDVEVHVFKGEVVVEHTARASAQAGSHVLHDQGLRMESGTAGPLLVEEQGESFIRTIDDADRDKHVVAYWRFEDHPVGAVVPDTSGNTKPVRGTVDSSFNGNDLFTYSASTRPRFSDDAPPDSLLQSGAANRGCLDNTVPPVEGAPTRDLYTRSRVSHASPIDIQKVKLAKWTIETSVKAKVLKVGSQTFLGRDGGQGAVMAFKINPYDRFEIYFKDIKHHAHRAVAKLHVQANQWYHLAAVSDGQNLRLYVDSRDGRGYRLCDTSYLYPEHGATVLGSTNGNAEWSVGRGRMNRLTCEWFQGWIDEVRVCNVALAPGDFLFAAPSDGKRSQVAAAKVTASGTSPSGSAVAIPSRRPN